MNASSCALCGAVATVLYEDNEGWVTPLCESCLIKCREFAGEPNNMEEMKND
jgi:hypothetical protein